jgi:hypothetical protein
MAVERDPSLPTAGISGQFGSLILGSSDFLAAYELIVIVIDALDEGYNHNNNLLVILANKISLLPSNFRFVLTSRGEEDIERFLHGKTHIKRRSMGIHGRPRRTLPRIFGTGWKRSRRSEPYPQIGRMTGKMLS